MDLLQLWSLEGSITVTYASICVSCLDYVYEYKYEDSLHLWSPEWGPSPFSLTFLIVFDSKWTDIP